MSKKKLVAPPFEYHAPDAIQLDALQKIREKFSALYIYLEETLTEGHEKSVVLVHLETAAMFANKSVTHALPKTPFASIREENI